MKTAVLSPHRDDAAFSLGLAVDIWLAQGRSVEIIDCFTRSAYAPFSDASSLHENDRRSFVTELRRREDEDWQRLCGRGLSLRDLKLKDAPLRLSCSSDEVCALPVRPEEKAAKKICGAIQAFEGAIALPLGWGGHVDHLTAREAALSALRGGEALAFYEDLPYAARGNAGAIPQAVAELASRLGAAIEPFFAGPETDIDISIARKKRHALCYDSQIGSEDVDRIAEFCGRYQGRERLWATSAWRDAQERSR